MQINIIHNIIMKQEAEQRRSTFVQTILQLARRIFDSPSSLLLEYMSTVKAASDKLPYLI